VGSRVQPPFESAALGEAEGLSGIQLEAIATIWKRERRELAARFGGSSMEPTIPPGAEVLLQCGVLPAPGEIAAFILGDRIMVHRVVTRSPVRGPWLLTRGDASAIPDPPIAETAVIGTVVRVRRGDRFVKPASPPTSFGRRLALTLCLLGLRVRRPAGERLIELLWVLRRWLVLAPRAAAGQIRSALARHGP
jgi:hypothetical protein